MTHRLKGPPLLTCDDGRIVSFVHNQRQKLWLRYCYCLCPDDGSRSEFDVRNAPGYTDKCERMPPQEGDDWLAAVMAHRDAERRYHAEVIREALDSGWRPER
jgi:hypothetical protein